MNISKINSFKFTTFGKTSAVASMKPYGKLGLQKDTFAASVPMARHINEIENKYNSFKTNITDTFCDCCQSELSSPKKSLGIIKFNDKNFDDAVKRAKKCTTKNQINKVFNSENSICGRIVLKKGTTQQEASKLINHLINEVKNNKFKISEVKIYDEKPDFSYVPHKKIGDLVNTVADMGQSCTRTENRKDTGYHGVHIVFNLMDGLQGELQIMGEEVEKLKDVENVLYRLGKGLPIKDGYKKVETAYKNLTNKQKQDLIRYTRETYFSQRAKELGLNFGEGFTKLDTKKYDLPTIFDFNNLKKIKEKVDNP